MTLKLFEEKLREQCRRDYKDVKDGKRCERGERAMALKLFERDFMGK